MGFSVLDELPARERIVGEWQPPGLLRPRMPRFQNMLPVGSSMADIIARLRRRPALWVEFRSLVGEEITEAIVEDLLHAAPRNGFHWASLPAAEWIGKWIDREFSANPPRQADLRKALQLARCFCDAKTNAEGGYAALTAGRAALFLGLLFVGPDAEHLLDCGRVLILRVLDGEFLDDGGHRSCSPMWQALLVEGFLDCLNLAGAYPRRFPDPLAEHLRTRLPGLLGWLRRLTMPDGSLAYFHDTTLGVAAFPGELLRYAESLGIHAEHCQGHDGFVRLECRDSLVLFDANNGGLDSSQHDAMFSFNWSHKGRPLVGNPGISTWENEQVRQIESSAAGHPVLVVDGQRQSATGTLLRKARPASRIKLSTDHQTYVECEHDGYARLLNPVIHRRRIEVHEGFLRVSDSLEGKGRHRVRMWFPFRPKVTPRIVPDPQLQVAEVSSQYAAGLRVMMPTDGVECSWEGLCPVNFESILPAG
jgi:hypothetical protein